MNQRIYPRDKKHMRKTKIQKYLVGNELQIEAAYAIGSALREKTQDAVIPLNVYLPFLFF